MNDKMKTLLTGIAFLGLGLVALLQGCASQIAPVSAMVVPQAPPLASDYISNFENNSIYVNRNLLGYPSPNASSVTQLAPNGTSSGGGSSFNTGYWAVATYGGPPSSANTADTSGFVVSNALPDATDSSNFAIHLGWPGGPLTLIATGIGNGYESDQLTCHLENNPSNPYYDASSFTGISFYYNIPADDTNTNRVFQIATINTTASYNHFQVALPGGSSGGWQAVTFMWSAFSCPFGSCNGALTTTGPLGNLNHIPFIQWQFSDNKPGQNVTLPGALAPNPPGSASATIVSGGSTVVYNPLTYTDLWVDNVHFVP